MTRHSRSHWLLAVAMSGVLCAAAATEEFGIDRPGGNLKPGFDLPAADPALCRQACDGEPACKAWTYVKPGVQGPGARCWLKSTVPAAVANDCCVSGTRGGTGPAVPPPALTPIQLPAPQTKSANLPGPLPQPASPGAAPAPPPPPPPQPSSMPIQIPAPADLPGPLPTPAKLTQLGAPMTRQAMIETLAAQPATRSALEKVATSAGTTIGGLVTGQLATTLLQVSGVGTSDSPQALLDLWKAPVRCSPTRPGPAYSYGGTTGFVSVTYFKGITQHNFRGDLERMLQTEVLSFAPDSEIWVYLDLPSGGGQYVLAVHIVDTYGKSVSPLGKQLVAGRVYGLGSKGGSSELSFVPNSDGTALVALFSDSTENGGVTPPPEMQMRQQSVLLRLFTHDHSGYYAGVTVTRL